MKVKLDSVDRTDGNLPMDDERVGRKYQVLHALVGAPAIFLQLGVMDKGLRTSTVKSVGIHERNLIIETRNTKYYFEIME